MNLDTVKHSQDALHFRTEGVLFFMVSNHMDQVEYLIKLKCICYYIQLTGGCD